MESGGRRDGGTNELSRSQDRTHPSPEKFYTFVRDGQWGNYSNRVGDQYLDPGAMYAQFLSGSLNPLGTYGNSEEAYQNYLSLGGYNQKSGYGQEPYSSRPSRSAWNPIFMPNALGISKPDISGPGGTGVMPPPTPPPAPVGATPPSPMAPAPPSPMNRAMNSLTDSAFGPAGLSWANNGWQQNELFSGDRYGEFGTHRGL